MLGSFTFVIGSRPWVDGADHVYWISRDLVGRTFTFTLFRSDGHFPVALDCQERTRLSASLSTKLTSVHLAPSNFGLTTHVS